MFPLWRGKGTRGADASHRLASKRRREHCDSEVGKDSADLSEKNSQPWEWGEKGDF